MCTYHIARHELSDGSHTFDVVLSQGHEHVSIFAMDEPAAQAIVRGLTYLFSRHAASNLTKRDAG